MCCFLLFALPGSKAQGRGAFKYRTSQRAGADGGAGGGKDSPTLGADLLPWVSMTKATALAGKRRRTRRYRVLFGTRGERHCGKR